MPDPVQPLSATWRQWIERYGPQHVTQPPPVEMAPDCDAIVVGSGYGGSVAALRLAEKGYRVLLLERGSEYLAGEFPNDFSSCPNTCGPTFPDMVCRWVGLPACTSSPRARAWSPSAATAWGVAA